MKRIIIGVVALVVSLTIVSVVSADSLESDKQNTLAVQVQLGKIADKYEIGEKLTAEDEKYVREHATPADASNNVTSKAGLTKTVFGQETYDGVTGIVQGQINVSNGVINNVFSGDITTVTDTIVDEIETRLRHSAFGSEGGGLKKIVDVTFSDSDTNTRGVRITREHRYAGVVAYSVSYAEGTVTVGSHSFDINAY